MAAHHITRSSVQRRENTSTSCSIPEDYIVDNIKVLGCSFFSNNDAQMERANLSLYRCEDRDICAFATVSDVPHI